MISNYIRTSSLCAVAAVFTACLLTPGLYAQTMGDSTATPNRITQTIDNSTRVTLRGMVNPLANAANDRGAAPASMAVNSMHLVLKRSASQEAALRTLIREQNTPGSTEYHKWLTPTEFGQQFGPSSEDVSTVESWLSSEGFGGVKANPGRLTIEFSGTVAQVANTFHAQFHQYSVKGATHYGVASNPQIPAALAPVVQGFVALNNFPVHRESQLLGKASYDPETHKTTPEWTYPTGGEPEFAVSPQDFAVEYNLPNSSLNAGYSGTQYTGANQTIAIVNDANINVSLVNSFRSLFGLPANPPHVMIVGNDPGVDGINNPDGPNDDSIEAYLDVEEAGAVAPDATVDLVIAADTSSENGLILAAEDAVYSDIAPVLSLSFGLCEQDLGSSNQFINQLWEQAAAEGITVVVSTGDSGSAGCDDADTASYATAGLAVSGFASTPYDVAAGGTDFYYSDWSQGASAAENQIGNYWNTTATNSPQVSIKSYVPEQVWNDSQYGDNILNYDAEVGTTTIAAGSGGASSCATGTVNSSTGEYSACSGGYAKPAWQNGLGTAMRDVPDVSLFAADGANLSFTPICAEDGDCQPASGGDPVQITGIGGTSVAAPAFAGIMALVNEKYGPQGQADDILYPLAAKYPGAFHDVTEGTNSVPCEISPKLSTSCISAGSNAITFKDSSGTSVTEGEIGTGTTADYSAGTGYDLATGLGSVNAATMIADWGNVTFATSGVTLTSPTAGMTITHGDSVTFTGTVTGTTPTGNVAIETDSTEPGQQGQTTFALSSGAFSGSIVSLPGGTYNVWAQYSGDTKNAASSSTPVQITVSQESSTLLFEASQYNSSGSQESVSGASIAYGTQVFLDARPYGSTYYSNCVVTKGSNCPAQTAATGTVTFTDGSTALNTAVIDAEGTAEYVTPVLAVGSHSITASYSGDNSYKSSAGSAVSLTVTKATPVIQVAAPTTGGNTGQNYVLTVLVDSNGIGVAPTGTVTVTGAPSGTTASATLGSTADPDYGNTSAVANVIIPSSTAAGTYSLTISYGGDANYNSYSTTYNLTEGAAATGAASSISATASATSSTTTAPITVKATVTGQSGKAAPTGTVYFLAGILNLSSTASSNIEDSTLFSGSLTTGSGDTSTLSGIVDSEDLVQGDNYLTVYYGGDSNYAASSTVLNLSNPLADFSMVAEMPLVPISGTTPVTDVVNLTSVNGFSGTVALSCTAPTGLSCSLSQSSVSLTSSTAVTTGATSELRKLMLFSSGGGMALGCLLLLGVPARKRKWRMMLGMVLLFAVCSFGVLGCGSSSGTGTGGTGSTGGTGGTGGSGGTSGGGSTGGTTVTVTGSGGTSGLNTAVPVNVTITGNGSIAPGSYPVVVTGTASSTSQVHTITITSVVQ